MFQVKWVLDRSRLKSAWLTRRIAAARAAVAEGEEAPLATVEAAAPDGERWITATEVWPAVRGAATTAGGRAAPPAARLLQVPRRDGRRPRRGRRPRELHPALLREARRRTTTRITNTTSSTRNSSRSSRTPLPPGPSGSSNNSSSNNNSKIEARGGYYGEIYYKGST